MIMNFSISLIFGLCFFKSKTILVYNNYDTVGHVHLSKNLSNDFKQDKAVQRISISFWHPRLASLEQPEIYTVVL